MERKQITVDGINYILIFSLQLVDNTKQTAICNSSKINKELKSKELTGSFSFGMIKESRFDCRIW